MASDPVSIELGMYVRRLREERGLSVRALAAKADVDSTWLSRLEHGAYHSPDPHLLKQLAWALDVTVADMYTAAGYPATPELPTLQPYLRAKYALPEEAAAEVQAYFDFINARYTKEGGNHEQDRHHREAA